mmetsp:Transcript_3591/g.4225  ORF Transcript_3591/g.4225 Transcript_3591/m.4225 type:complete len:313 (-) Transcript_3591:2389-3327(-)
MSLCFVHNAKKVSISAPFLLLMLLLPYCYGFSVLHLNSQRTNSITSLKARIQPRRNIIIAFSSTILTLSAEVLLPNRSQAISSKEAETSYNKYAKSYDELDGGSVATSLGIEEEREEKIKQARGRVLEVAVGTGLNLRKYVFASSPESTDGVTSLTLLDISDGMLSEAKSKIDAMNIPSYVDVHFIKADATSSDITSMFGESYFDTVLDTFSLCVMGSIGAKKCLEQMRNVVKSDADGGKILLIENAKSSNAVLGWYQDVTSSAAAQLGGKGCVSNQNVKALVEGTSGLRVEKESEFAAGLFRSFTCVKSSS